MEIFTWVVALLVSIMMPVLAWLLFRVHSLSVDVAVLKAKTYIDPIEYTEIITNLTSTMRELKSEIQLMRSYIERGGVNAR